MGAEEGSSRLRHVVGSVRFRVTALATLAVIIVLSITAVVLLEVQRKQLTENLDDTLRQRADDLSVVAEAGPPPAILVSGSHSDTLAQIVTPDGRVAASSAELERQPAVTPPPPVGTSEVLRSVGRLPTDDRPFRLLSRRTETPAGAVVINIASNLDDIHDSTEVLEDSLLVAIPTVAVLLAGLVWWLVGRTLRPVEAIRGEVAAIGATELHRRVSQPKGEDEISGLARTMNGMLDRLEDATQRQNRFVADASHELRSPLTRIRSEIEVDLAHPATADLAATHRSVLDETVGLQRLADDLLALARSDAGASKDRKEPVDLDDIVLRQARRLRADGRVGVGISGVSAAQVLGDPDELTRAIRNVADNAARHATTVVDFTLSERDGHAILTVMDDGPGIPPEQRQRVFERFTRLDDARSADDGGTGLGLAITRDIIGRHGGEITIDPDHRPGTRFTIWLPTNHS